MDYLLARSATNTAGSPLPRIPRRTSSTQRTFSSGITTPPKVNPSPVKITVQQATPPDDNSASTSGVTSDSSSSSSSSRLSPTRAKGPRSSRNAPAVPVEPVSPTFGIPRSKKERTLSLPKQSEPPVLSLSLEGLPSRTQSEIHIEFPLVEPSSHKSAPPLPPVLAVRKKSGQLVKPSLKASKSSFKGSLSVTPGGLSSKSEPTTPTVPKAVKFDSRLEHVKLFLAEQRPLAVSRDGSPTDDTSGAESDFPSFIFGKSKSLKMTVANMPPSLNLNTDIVMEEMKLSSDGFNIVGRIRVRNLSFHKWVATTSEVTAKYLESAGGEFDVFGFTIRLSDLMARIEEKTLIVALRYNVDGREIWDNNFGRNYVVKFTKEMPKPVEQPSVSASGSDRDISSGSDISDLHSRLEKVVKKRDEAVAAPLSQPILTSPEPTSPLKAETSLSSRYDFGAALKSAFSPTFNIREHNRMHSYPLVSSSSVDSVPWPEMPKRRRSIPKEKPALGSPRDLDDTFRPAPFVPSDAEDGPEIEPVVRNHQRGYFDLSGMGLVESPRYYSLPAIRPRSPYRAPGLGYGLAPKEALLAEASDGGSSSLISPPITESESSTPAGSPPFALSPVESASPKTNYNQFLNRFCFFTGLESSGGNSSDESASEPISRSSSTSSVDEFLSSSSPRLHGIGGLHLFSPQPATQTPDDMSIRINSELSPPSTPTSPERLVGPDSRSVTPTR
ncbi:hypothetical protein BT96DRAFT_1062211 [Gymnopus androsaceus JB14]|uniref:CBM21 domain-containing protein n=1 Tax=Gymnopus androsaceus JB14 TaxID=1447944 RepID=A0A6A4H041_9AGAR|nr:hypothetical protein BT96DRAFT_1062211 [Gymnopus androsaceus JB14]